MNHIFNISFATKYGMEEAVLFQNIAHWVLHNKANGTNKHDGYFWTYNSVKAFKELFPYMTPAKIRRALSNLESKGIIKVGEYNEHSYDRTKWYTLTEYGLSMWRIDITDITTPFVKIENGDDNIINPNVQNSKPIPDINTNINTDIKPNIKDNDVIFENEKIEIIESEENRVYGMNVNDRIPEFKSIEDYKSWLNAQNNINEAPGRGEHLTRQIKTEALKQTKLQRTFEDFKEMRIKMRCKLTDNAEKLIKKRLVELSGGNEELAIQILEQSIMNGWRSVFELRAESRKNQKQSGEAIIKDVVSGYINKLYSE